MQADAIDLQLLEPAAASRLVQYVQDNSQSCIYHAPAWGDVLSESLGFKIQYVVAETGDRIVGAIPLCQIRSILLGNRLVSLPFSHAVPVLSESVAISRKMVSFIEDLAKQRHCDYVELKTALPEECYSTWQLFEANHQTVVAVEESEEAQWQALSGSARRAIKRAQKEGIETRPIRDDQDLESAISLLTRTRHRQGSPPHPPAFFRKLFERLLPEDTIWGLIASDKGQDVATILITEHKGTAVYAYGGSFASSEVMQKRPNNLLFWQAMRNCAERGCKLFDFGSTPAGAEGLRRFKESWGGTSHSLPYSYLCLSSRTPAALKRSEGGFDIVTTALQRLPYPAFRAAGSILFRQLG